jgi:hypothetical protein
MESMVYLEHCTDPGQTAMEIQARGSAQLNERCDAAGRAGGRQPSDSDLPFRPRTNYAVPSGRYSLPDMKLSSILAVLLFAVSSAAQASIINAASPSRADVVTAINSAANGDTIIVPAGTASWTTGITVTKGITLQGQTTTNSANGTANDQTILVDNLADVGGGQGFFMCTTNTGQSLRISGFTFTGVGGRTTTIYNGAIRFSGTSDRVRIDHCHFTGGLKHLNYIAVYSTIYGVADHLVFDQMPSQLGQQRAFNGTGYGDLEFSQPAGWGSNKFFFMEDCYINNTAGPNTASGGWDAWHGGKFVVRYCKLFNVEILCHGTEDGRDRGGRAQEIYNNEYHWDHTTTLDGIRTGSLLAHDNTFVGNRPNGYGLQTYRTFYAWQGSIWKGASGDNPWDYNVTEANGTHVDGHPPYLFGSGTFTSGTSGNTLVDSTKTWTTNQWVGYQVKRTSDGATAYIQGNNATTLTVFQWNSQGFASGQGYQIHKVLVALDQPGSGAGDLLTGDNPTPRWLNQVREPCYSWNNIHPASGGHINWYVAINPPMQEGRDYFSDTPMPGYTPYTYPHPLVSGGGGAPQAPQNLRIVP